jgi:parallel beta-helix repeat protein
MVNLILCAAIALHTDSPTIIVDRDNIEITESCIVQNAANPIIDSDNNGVIHITRGGITVDFNHQHLHGAKSEQTPDTFSGFGIKITAKDVTLKNANVSGFKVGIHALNADGLTIHDCDVSNNFHQRLKSTPQAEDASDWLWPHNNDNNEWMTNYGAGICVEGSNNVTLHDIKARKTQNGIILDRVNDSKVYDCDCSFLSGWGLAMWRSNRNVISRNAFDFCVRGYSHGVYNRGQDSAGILMFEQCSENVIAENSVTHGGDGLFAFAGKESLGEISGTGVAPVREPEWHKRRGNNRNIIAYNQFSYAAAHGIELTFSFDNFIFENALWNNAICGIWAGYSQGTEIFGNIIITNGGMAYGLERGGMNIEHGYRNRIHKNQFLGNTCGVHLWWDDDAALFTLPWARANYRGSLENVVTHNSFERETIAIHLRRVDDTYVSGNTFKAVDQELQAEDSSRVIRHPSDQPEPVVPTFAVNGDKKPIGARDHLMGRQNIIMTEWGPFDWQSFVLQRVDESGSQHEYRLLGNFPRIFKGLTAESIKTDGSVEVTMTGDASFTVQAKHTNTLTPYRVSIRMNDDPDGVVSHQGALTGGTWEVWTFKSACDPREDVERWRREGTANHHTLTAHAIDFRFGSNGMSEARGLPVELPRDHFGVIATRSLTIPAGKWRLKTISDDGIRAWMDDQLVIDDWTWHGPTRHDYDFEVREPHQHTFQVEYFELDGYAVLALDFERIDDR